MIPVDSMIKRTVLVATAAIAALSAVACGDDSPAATGDTFWADTYNPAGQPAANTAIVYHKPENGHPGPCLTAPGCHSPADTSATSAKPKMAYGGVVYKSDGKTRAPNVQVGVVSGTTYKQFAYSRSDGLYWVEGTPPDAATWKASDIRIRNTAGEKKKAAKDDRNGDCDFCHKETGGSAKALMTL